MGKISVQLFQSWLNVAFKTTGCDPWLLIFNPFRVVKNPYSNKFIPIPLKIYNRDFSQFYINQNFLPNDPAHSWDGLFRGQIMNPAVFVYFAEIEFLDGEKRIFKGDVTLMR